MQQHVFGMKLVGDQSATEHHFLPTTSLAPPPLRVGVHPPPPILLLLLALSRAPPRLPHSSLPPTAQHRVTNVEEIAQQPIDIRGRNVPGACRPQCWVEEEVTRVIVLLLRSRCQGHLVRLRLQPFADKLQFASASAGGMILAAPVVVPPALILIIIVISLAKRTFSRQNTTMAIIRA